MSWEVVEQLLKDWGQLPSPIEPHLVAMAPIAITANYMQSVLSRQKAILEAITLRTTGSATLACNYCSMLGLRIAVDHNRDQIFVTQTADNRWS